MIQKFCLTLIMLVLTSTASAQQSERFGPYELHYSVVNTTFLDPRVAASYGITRGKNRAILNLAVREHVGDGTEARAMMIQGYTRDLITGESLEFLEVRESGAIYYIAEFGFINEEWRFFEIDFRPEGADTTYRFEHRHQLYVN